MVPNKATVSALGLLGRYLAYLSDRGGVAPDPALIEAGKHLRFYARHARVPGQSLLVALDQLVRTTGPPCSHHSSRRTWPPSTRRSTRAGRHPFEASAAAEATTRIGPEPTEDIDRTTEALLAEFNAARGTSMTRRSPGR